MTSKEYINRINELNIRQYGFDTHARVLDIDREEVKRLWNEATDYEFKRFPRTEYTMLPRPAISTREKPYWELVLPEGRDYMMFYMTPTTPVIIPNGFITDKGSIPWFFRNIVAHDDREMMLAYLVHDLEREMKRMTNFTIDGLLYEVGVVMKSNWMKRNVIYTAVRAASWLKVPDRVIRGFNVSKFNRELIAKTETQFLQDNHTKHLVFLQEMRINRAKI